MYCGKQRLCMTQNTHDTTTNQQKQMATTTKTDEQKNAKREENSFSKCCQRQCHFHNWTSASHRITCVPTTTLHFISSQAFEFHIRLEMLWIISPHICRSSWMCTLRCFMCLFNFQPPLNVCAWLIISVRYNNTTPNSIKQNINMENNTNCRLHGAASTSFSDSLHFHFSLSCNLV